MATPKRERIRGELLADGRRPDREIARVTGASHPTVAAVRAELEAAGEIPHFAGQKGRPRKDGTPVQPRPEVPAPRPARQLRYTRADYLAAIAAARTSPCPECGYPRRPGTPCYGCQAMESGAWVPPARLRKT